MDVIAGNKIKSDKIINYHGFWSKGAFEKHASSVILSFLLNVK